MINDGLRLFKIIYDDEMMIRYDLRWFKIQDDLMKNYNDKMMS